MIKENKAYLYAIYATYSIWTGSKRKYNGCKFLNIYKKSLHELPSVVIVFKEPSIFSISKKIYCLRASNLKIIRSLHFSRYCFCQALRKPRMHIKTRARHALP